MKIILLGAPGAGKGTYASQLKKTYNIPHISTGDLLRKAIEDCDEIGIEAKEHMDKGMLVPDKIIVDLLKKRLEQEDAQEGALLDGFPRTIEQAELLDEIIVIDKVLKFDVEEDTVLRRLGGRIICKGCGAIFHERNIIPKKEGVCDHCEDELYQRDDDKKETILKRLEVYHEQTAPLTNHYSSKNILHSINANTDMNDPSCSVVEECEKILDEICDNKRTE